MAVAPPIYVQAPILTPSRYGLLSAADMPITTDPHLRNGVEFETNPCGPSKIDAADCASPHNRNNLTDGIPLVEAGPIVVYDGFTCRPVGLDEPALLARARAALAAGESAAVEKTVWASAAPLRLMADGVTDELTTAAVPLVKGIGLLEEHLRSEYGGVGVIHAPVMVAPYAAEKQQIDSDNGRKTTVLGTRWSFGAYPNSGPDGTAAAVDTAWLVATGAVSLRRTEVTARAVFNDKTNEVLALAERTYVVAWECVTAAALVSLT